MTDAPDTRRPKKFEKQPEDAPVIPSLASRMVIELMVSPDGKAIMLHKAAIPVPIWWAEYDVELNSLYFVTVRGQLMGYGMKMPKRMGEYLMRGDEILFQQIDNDKKNVGLPNLVPLVVRHSEALSAVIARTEDPPPIQTSRGITDL
jgi:hypothetical protein